MHWMRNPDYCQANDYNAWMRQSRSTTLPFLESNNY